jgi:hypothetical protein
MNSRANRIDAEFSAVAEKIEKFHTEAVEEHKVPAIGRRSGKPRAEWELELHTRIARLAAVS